jgi:hypothetical protein
MKKITLIILLILFSFSINAKEQSKNIIYDKNSAISPEAQIFLLSFYKEKLSKLKVQIIDFNSLVQRDRYVSVQLYQSKWMSIVRSFQEFGIPFTTDKSLVIPTYYDFEHKNFNFNYPLKSLQKEIDLIDGFLY